MANLKLSSSVRVYLDPDVFTRMRISAREADLSLSGFISDLVRREVDPHPAVADRNTVVLEYFSIQLDLILAHLSPELKKKAREVFKAKNADAGTLIEDAGNAL